MEMLLCTLAFICIHVRPDLITREALSEHLSQLLPAGPQEQSSRVQEDTRSLTHTDGLTHCTLCLSLEIYPADCLLSVPCKYVCGLLIF